jgi:glycosyltransferase involved in cell wall biosynthesis
MKVSVIVPTYNGEKKIENILKSLESQDFQDFETVIVIDGSTDDTVSYIKNRDSKLKNLVLIEQSNKGRSGARNAGARAANGDLFVFFDDDIILETNCLSALVNHHVELDGDSIAGGRQIIPIGKDVSPFQNYRRFLTLKWDDYLLKIKGPINKHQPFFTAAIFSIKRTTFWSVGGFNEKITDAEDALMAEELNAHGVPIYYLKAAIGYHFDNVTIRQYIKRLRQYREAHEKLRELKNKGELAYIPERYLSSISKISKFRFWIFSNLFFLEMIENERVMKLLPQKVRHTLYDWVVTSLGTYHRSKKI